MTRTPLSRMQRTVAAMYCGGDMAHVETKEELEDCGDTLFAFVMREIEGATSREEVEQLLLTAIEQLQGVVDGLDDVPQIPLADRYAEKVIQDSSSVLELEIQGVKYTNDRLDVYTDNESPDFFSVCAHLRNGSATAVGDFIAHEAAIEYAEHLQREWGLTTPIRNQVSPKVVNP